MRLKREKQKKDKDKHKLELPENKYRPPTPLRYVFDEDYLEKKKLKLVVTGHSLGGGV